MKSRSHLTGLQARLRILKALFTNRTDGLIREVSTYLDNMGHIYPGILANVDPLSFVTRFIDNNLYYLRNDFLDFSSLENHDFLNQGNTLPEDWVAEVEVSQFLGKLTFLLHPKNVVEIGCFVGVTSSHIAKALDILKGEYNLFCIDIDKRYLDITANNLKTLGLFYGFHPILGKSLDQNVLNTIPDNIDLIYIDSSHEYENTIQEIEIYSQRLTTSGCLVLHDSVQWPGVRNAVTKFGKIYDLMTFATSRGNGVTVMMRKL